MSASPDQIVNRHAQAAVPLFAGLAGFDESYACRQGGLFPDWLEFDLPKFRGWINLSMPPEPNTVVTTGQPSEPSIVTSFCPAEPMGI